MRFASEKLAMAFVDEFMPDEEFAIIRLICNKTDEVFFVIYRMLTGNFIHLN
jgi:hypothetical protein